MSLHPARPRTFPLLELYKKGDELGTGTFGEVRRYKLLDPTGASDEKPECVAVKKYKMSNKRYLEERNTGHGYAILKGLRHENLLRIFDIFDHKKHAYAVMELADDSLESLINARRLDRDESAFVILQIVLGLSYLHSKGVIHRDLKPPNILIKGKSTEHLPGLCFYDLTLLIADYDFARVFGETEPDDTASMTVLGTLIYAAPEIRSAWNLSRTVPYTESADIFSLGVMSFQIFTGIKIRDMEVEIDRLLSQVENHPELSGSDFLSYLRPQLDIDKRKRSGPAQLLSHDFFRASGNCHDRMRLLMGRAEQVSLLHEYREQVKDMETKLEQMQQATRRHQLVSQRQEAIAERDSLRAGSVSMSEKLGQLQAQRTTMQAEFDRVAQERDMLKAKSMSLEETVQRLQAQVDDQDETESSGSGPGLNVLDGSSFMKMFEQGLSRAMPPLPKHQHSGSGYD